MKLCRRRPPTSVSASLKTTFSAQFSSASSGTGTWRLVWISRCLRILLGLRGHPRSSLLPGCVTAHASRIAYGALPHAIGSTLVSSTKTSWVFTRTLRLITTQNPLNGPNIVGGVYSLSDTPFSFHHLSQIAIQTSSVILSQTTNRNAKRQVGRHLYR